MKKITITIGLLWVLFCLAGAGCQASGGGEQEKDVLFQYSTLNSLMAGVYDGQMTFKELKQHGDLGLGTFNALDGEMIEIDRQFYQVKSDGVAYPVDDAMKAPFAVVTSFEADQTVDIDLPMDCEALKKHLDNLLPTENIPYAMKITGTFSHMQTRSVPAQEKPYRPLLEVIKTQPTFDFQNIEGVMLGFRLPDYMEGVNAAGYHFHFINAERNAGGHVLSCQAQSITVEIDYTDEWYMLLPEDEAFYNIEMSSEKYQ